MSKLIVIAKKRKSLYVESTTTFTIRLESKDTTTVAKLLPKICKGLNFNKDEEEYLNQRLGKWMLNNKENCNITIQR